MALDGSRDGLSRKKMRCEDFDFKTVISRGTFGVVYRATRKEDGKEFALKQVSLAGLGRAEREECIDEARILSQLHHPHIVRHYDSFVDTKEQKLNIFMEYAAGGTVHHLVSKRGRRIDEPDCWRYFIQCLLALDHIHSKKIIHRDMKSLNVFLDSNNNVKIGDFGIARSLSNNSDFARTIVGTPFYLSPELCDDKPYNEKSDIWALGVILYECCTGQQPFTAQNEGALIRKILRGKFPPPVGCSIEMVQTVNKCLCYDHKRRPTAGQLLAWSVIRLTARRLGLDIDMNKKLHLLKQTPTPKPPPPVVHSPKKTVPKEASETEIPPAEQHINVENESKQSNRKAQAVVEKGGDVFHKEPHIFDMDCEEESCQKNKHMERPITTPPGNQGEIASQLQRPPTPANLNKEDHIRELMKGFNDCKPEELHTGIRPEQLPAAGVQVQRNEKGFLMSFGKLDHNYRTMSQEQGRRVWSAKYEAPRYARKRCPELQATGPIFRGGGERGGGANSPRNNRTSGVRVQAVDTTSTSYERSCAPTVMTRGDS